MTPYDFIIVTEYATGIGWSGIDNIDNSGKPLLIIEYWDFYYAYAFDMSWDSWGDYLGNDTVHNPHDNHFITDPFGDTLGIHTEPWAVLTDVHISALKSGVEPLIYSDQYLQNVTVAVDDAKKRIVSGICDTTHFTAEAWDLFDQIVDYLQGATVFEDDFEDGDLNEWTQVLGDVSITTEAAHSGQYGVELSGENGLSVISMAIDTRGLGNITLSYARSILGVEGDIYVADVWAPGMIEPFVLDRYYPDSNPSGWEEIEVTLPPEVEDQEYVWLSFSYNPQISLPPMQFALLDTALIIADIVGYTPFIPEDKKDDKYQSALFKPWAIILTLPDDTETRYEYEQGDITYSECEWDTQTPIVANACCVQWNIDAPVKPTGQDMLIFKKLFFEGYSTAEACEASQDPLPNLAPRFYWRHPDYEQVEVPWFNNDTDDEFICENGAYEYESWNGVSPDDYVFPDYDYEYCAWVNPSGDQGDSSPGWPQAAWYRVEVNYHHADFMSSSANFTKDGVREDPDMLYFVFRTTRSTDHCSANRWLVKLRLQTSP